MDSQNTGELKTSQDDILLELIKEVCNENKLSTKLRGKVTRIIADCDLIHHSSLHKLSTADESTSSLLGFLHQSTTELTFDEQGELNQAVIQKIQNKIPQFTAELENLQLAQRNNGSCKSKIKEMQESLDDKLNSIQEQENEKVDLMMEWLDHKINEVTQYSDNSTELLTLKTRIMELKSKIFHVQILQMIFTETNQSIKAYSEIHKDLKDAIKETELQIKHYKEVIESDYK